MGGGWWCPFESTPQCSAAMPQLNGGGGDDLGANDEMISFKDEGEQEEKISENVSAERDLDDVKSSLVNESESSSDSEVRSALGEISVWWPFKLSILSSLLVSKRRGGPKPEATRRVTRKRGTTSVKVKKKKKKKEKKERERREKRI